MNIFTRAWLYIHRNKTRNILIFVIITLLSSFVTATVISNRVVITTVQQLSLTIPDEFLLDMPAHPLQNVRDSLHSVQQLSTAILWISIGATAITLCLLMMLSIRERHQEIGIYVSLGESKVNILLQLLLETCFPSFPAILLALFAGSHFAALLSRWILMPNLSTLPYISATAIPTSNNDSLLMLFLTFLSILIIVTLFTASQILRLNPRQIQLLGD